MKVICLNAIRYERKNYAPKDVLEIEDSEALRLIDLGAVKSTEEPIEQIEELKKEIKTTIIKKDEPVSISDLTIEELKEEIESMDGEYPKNAKKEELVKILTQLLKADQE